MRLPTTEEIRYAFAEIDSRYSDDTTTYAESVRDFDAWLEGVKSQARIEGYRQGYNQGQDDVYNPRTMDED